MRILLAIPHGSKPLEPECIEALWQMDKCGHDVFLRIVDGYDCARARNKIAQESTDLLCDKCMMVDSDVIVPTDALAHLLEGGAPIVLGCYRHKDDTGNAELFDSRPYTWRVPWDGMPDGRFEVAGGGFGCVLVDVSAFRKLPRPWFAYPEFADGGFVSEDLWFCELAAKAQMRIEADGRVKCKHIGKRVYE